MEPPRKIGFTLGESSQVSICQNCVGGQYQEESAAFDRQRLRSQSTCESLLSSPFSDFNKQYNDIILSYHKLKISFTVMLILNAILLMVVIACMVLIIPKISTEADSKSQNKGSTSVVVPTPKTDALQNQPTTPGKHAYPEDGADMVKCKTIKDKLRTVYKNGQRVDNVVGQMCSIGDLIESVMQNMKMLNQKENTKAAFHFITPNGELPACHSKKTLKCLKNYELKINTTEVQVNEEKIIIMKTGVYFIYNRVSININVSGGTDIGTIDHSLMHSNSGHGFKAVESSKIACTVTNKQFNHISYIEKVQFLEKGDELQVALKTPLRRDIGPIQSSSTFGMFEL